VIYKLLIIAKNTLTETLRQPVYAVIIAFSLFLFFMSPSIAMYSMDEDIKMLRELGLSTLVLTGLFIAIFSATAAVTEEIETKTITTVLSKPVGRPTFILGKFLGVTAAVVLAHYICTIALIMAVRHGVLESASDTHDWPVIATAAAVVFLSLLLTSFLNYIYDWNFSATIIILTAVFITFGIIFLSFIDKGWKFNPQNNNLHAFDIYASVLLLFAVIVLVAIAIMFSTRFNVVLTLAFCVGTFLLGLISDYVFGRFAQTNFWAKIGHILAPNLQVFWISDAIYEGSSIEPYYLLLGGGYAILYTTGILLLAIALFQRRQVG
jgi:ABC-type transport system involved in multi-copper enzyme maturation permease subunit